MRRIARALLAVGFCAAFSLPASSWARKCPADSVQVGDVCVDKYEASVWSTTDAATIKKIQRGKVTSALDLALATQHGATSHDFGAGCPDSGNGCVDYYAVSIAGVLPSAFVSQFQAMAMCRNAGKHLATNQEWQAAALGTPDPGTTDNGTTDCNVASVTGDPPEDPVNTGSRLGCVSDAGVFDMVGNLYEWVADWVPRSPAGPCPGWGGFSNDEMCLWGASPANPNYNGPGALVRGGHYAMDVSAGPFTVSGTGVPWDWASGTGFRCARRL
jgi:hypothetical protein